MARTERHQRIFTFFFLFFFFINYTTYYRDYGYSNFELKFTFSYKVDADI